MSLRAKLLCAQLPLALALVLLGIASIRTVASLGRSSQRILQDNYRSVLAAQRMKEAIERIDSAALFRVAGRPERAEGQAAPNRQLFEVELQVQEKNITEPGEGEATARLRALWAEYQAKVQRFAALKDPAELRERYFSELEPAFLQVKAAADRILDINQDAMVLKSERARRASEANNERLVVATLVALLVGTLASIAFTTRLLRPLASLSVAVRRIGEGDLDARAKVESEDEIGRVGRELNTMADRLREYRRSSLGELLQAQQSSQAAIDSLPDPVVVQDVDGRVLNVNQAAETLLQIGTGTSGRDPLATLDPGVRAVLERVRAHVVAGRGAYVPRGFEESIRLRSLDGERYVLPRATPVYSEQGGVAGATIVLQDVTRLLRFDELKNDLVATVAHEFRTPLTSLRMAIHLCLERAAGAITEKQADLLSAAREDCERLQSMVDDLLDLSRVQAGKVEVSLTPLFAKTLVDQAVEQHRSDAAEAGLKLVEVLVDPVPVQVDPERIGLVFSNLIGNAIRHSRKGGRIEIRAQPQQGLVRFEVADEGEGIPREYQQRIFEKFFRVPGTKGEGIGLGLYLAREIVRAHGGEMGVESEPGKGSRFWFTLRVPGSERGVSAGAAA